MKENLLNKYLTAKSLQNGYFDMKNPSFDIKVYQKLTREVKELKNRLLQQGYTEEQLFNLEYKNQQEL